MPAQAQNENFRIVDADTVFIDSLTLDHSPRKAAMYSAVFPGLGQIYNKKYWKLPIVYGGLGALVYGTVWNSNEYAYYFDLYKYMKEENLQEWEGRTLKEVEWYKDSHLRYKNLMMILTVGFYVVQIVDANVDAHLIDFDISDDISMTIDPVMLNPVNLNPGRNRTTFGLQCCLSF